MKLRIGSSPGALQVSAPAGQSNCGTASLGVSATWSPDAPHPWAKGVLEHHPVADLVAERVTLAVLPRLPGVQVDAAGHRLVEDDDAVEEVATPVRGAPARPYPRVGPRGGIAPDWVGLLTAASMVLRC